MFLRNYIDKISDSGRKKICEIPFSPRRSGSISNNNVQLIFHSTLEDITRVENIQNLWKEKSSINKTASHHKKYEQ